MTHADGQQKKTPHSGDLIISRDGTPMMVLGKPIVSSGKVARMLEGALVVLMPDGRRALHMPDAAAGRPDFIGDWEWGWEPLGPAGHG
jgi:hypothetical protein